MSVKVYIFGKEITRKIHLWPRILLSNWFYMPYHFILKQIRPKLGEKSFPPKKNTPTKTQKHTNILTFKKKIGKKMSICQKIGPNL